MWGVNDPLSLAGRKSEHNLALSYDSYQYCILMNDLQIKRAAAPRNSIDAEEITDPCSRYASNPGFMSARFIKLIKLWLLPWNSSASFRMAGILVSNQNDFPCFHETVQKMSGISELLYFFWMLHLMMAGDEVEFANDLHRRNDFWNYILVYLYNFWNGILHGVQYAHFL